MGLFSKIFKGIKKVVKGVAKVIKKTVKGVAKVVKKVAKSKIFKAVLAAAAIYVTGGAAAGAFGASGTTGMFGKWATQYGSGIFSSGIGKAVATPFHMLGSAIGTGARAITDFTGITDPIGTDSILKPITTTAEGVPFEEAYRLPSGMSKEQFAIHRETDAWKKHIAEGQKANIASSTTKGSGWGKWAAGVGTNLATNVATGYVMNELTEGDPTGQMSGLAVEGEGQLDPFAVYYGDGKPLSVADAYSQLLYGTGDPMYNQGNTSNLYTQDIAPIAV